VIWIIVALVVLWLALVVAACSLAVMAKRGDRAMERRIDGPGVVETERY
jgi:biopolymer transport protein ExbB/TolQ